MGIDRRDAELLRVRSNAVFKLRSEIVVRIATAPDALTRLPLVLAVARWLAERGFPRYGRPTRSPTSRWCTRAGRSRSGGTCPASGRPTTTELGEILRRPAPAAGAAVRAASGSPTRWPRCAGRWTAGRTCSPPASGAGCATASRS